jgi:hypothetical protein
VASLCLPVREDGRSYQDFQRECRETAGEFRKLADRARAGEKKLTDTVEFLMAQLMRVSLMCEALFWSSFMDEEWLQRIWTAGDG